MTLLAQLALVSRNVAATSSRLAKIRELSGLLRTLEPDEIPIAIAFLSGETRQGKLGIAYAALRDAEWDAVLLQLPVNGWSGEELLEEVRRAAPATPCLVQGAPGEDWMQAVVWPSSARIRGCPPMRRRGTGWDRSKLPSTSGSPSGASLRPMNPGAAF